MTQPPDPQAPPPVEPGTTPAAAGEAPFPGESPIEAYVRQNRLRFSEPAIRQALLAAGNPPEVVDRALARHRRDPGSAGASRRAARLLLFIYLGVFALLSVGMILNVNAQSGDVYGSALLAVLVWAIVAAAGYGLSMIWVRSRRVGLLLGGLVVGVIGLSLIGGGIAGVAMIVVAVAMVAAAIAFGERIDSGFSTSAPVLLSVPLLILLALGGACVATGLPFPIN